MNTHTHTGTLDLLKCLTGCDISSPTMPVVWWKAQEQGPGI